MKINTFNSGITGLAFFAIAQASLATPIDCIGDAGSVNDTHSATANGEYADACHFEASNIADDSDITDHTNNLWGSIDNLFSFVGKDEIGSGVGGFELVVSSGNDDFEWSYQLIVPDAWVGQSVDWVLGVKQSSNSYMSYLFQDVVLGIEGGYNNFWLNGGGKETNDYSFAAGFIRLTDSVTVPEPGTALLLLTGFFGLVASRRTLSHRAAV